MDDKTRSGLLAMAAFIALTGCSVNSQKSTSWGKEGVSLLDYQTDTLLCATLAQQATTGNAANTAGGIYGKNGAGRIPGGLDNGTGASAGSGNASSIGGGTYEDHASPDYVSRAANQQRAREMQLKQVQVETMRSCLVERGYTEFELSAEQRAQLSQLAQGSEARQQYLYKLGTNPEVIRRKPVAN